MRYKYAVVEPGTGRWNTNLGRVLSRHTMLHTALAGRSATNDSSTQVRELAADVEVGEVIRIDHLRRWDD